MCYIPDSNTQCSQASNRAPYAIPTGRLDGKVSLQTNADTLPGSTTPIADIVARFAQEGFSAEETVILSGAHTVGQVRCEFFDDRLYDWDGTGEPDPSLNTTTAEQLRKTCTNTGAASEQNRVFLDQGPNSAFVIDKDYYVMLTQNNGVMESDQTLMTDPLTSDFVPPLALGSQDNFASKFEAALIKMGNLGALSSAKGDIRHVCSVLN
jgi:peroxidase